MPADRGPVHPREGSLIQEVCEPYVGPWAASQEEDGILGG